MIRARLVSNGLIFPHDIPVDIQLETLFLSNVSELSIEVKTLIIIIAYIIHSTGPNIIILVNNSWPFSDKTFCFVFFTVFLFCFIGSNFFINIFEFVIKIRFFSIPFLVANFASFNLAAKVSAVNLINSWVEYIWNDHEFYFQFLQFLC